MASITIRNLEDELKRRLRIRAAERGHSMEDEAHDILRAALNPEPAPSNLAATVRARFAPLGGVDLDIPPRQTVRQPSPSDRAD